MAEIVSAHPNLAMLSTWRVVVTATVEALDSSEQGKTLGTPKEIHADIMDRLREK